MELALAVRDVLLVPRCAGCGEPGSWFCVPCRVHSSRSSSPAILRGA